jgi:hypothetical protein
LNPGRSAWWNYLTAGRIAEKVAEGKMANSHGMALGFASMMAGSGPIVV